VTRTRAGVGLSLQGDPRAAAEEAAAAALAGAGGRADAALLFATPGHAEQMPALLEAAVGALGCRALVGASAHGVLAGGFECEGGTALAMLAVRGLEVCPFLLPDLAGDEGVAGPEIAARLGGAPRASDLVVLLPDPRALRAESLLAGVRAALGPAQVVGAGAADPVAAPPLQWCGREIETGALAGLVLRARRPARIGVTQACRPVSGLMTVTLARANWILELDGRPALDVYREVARAPLAADLRRAAAFLLVALPRDPDAEGALEPGGYLVRHVVGFAAEERALALPELVRSGSRVALALREPAAARDDLKAMLASLGGTPAAFGLYFDCCARGRALFGVEGLEAGYLSAALGETPVAGPFGSCEIGPIGGRTELLTYTGVLALVGP
jgi:small ligand-binding sensory domain FIST